MKRVLTAIIALGMFFSITPTVSTVYHELRSTGLYVALNPSVLDLAKKAYTKRKAIDSSTKQYVMIVDFTQPSDKYRMFVYDMVNNKIVYQGLVAHGVGSGKRYATDFSNVNMSKKSSLGLYKVTQTYSGKYGYSVRVSGLEKGFNDNAASRVIVVHPAPYVTDYIAKTYGAVGNSWGCFALDPAKSHDIINYIKHNGLIFAYYPDTKWLNNSEYLK